MKSISASILVLTMSLSLALVGCTSSTVIRSNVPGAKVFLNGAYVGNTPYTMSDTKIVGSSTSVRIEAPGYQTTNATISRNEQFSVGACIGGVFLFFPFLWIMDYKPDHMYQMLPGQSAPAGYPQQPGPQQPGAYPQPAPQPGTYPAPAPQPYPQPAPAPQPYPQR